MLEKLLERADQQEFQLLSDEIKQALFAHHLWMQEVHHAVASRKFLSDPSFSAEDAHLHCKLGQWLQQKLNHGNINREALLEIDQLHTQLHREARELLQKMHNDAHYDESGYATFLKTQHHFLNAYLKVLEISVVSESQFDPLTNLINRRIALTLLSHEKEKMKRSGDSTCCIGIADIDHFKAFNDQYGHDVGDRVLEFVADLFNQTIRRYDTVSRFGGEEFLFVMPNMGIEDATKTLERVRKCLESSSLSHKNKTLNVTASFGVTQLCPHCDINGSIKRADVALYYAKDAGRNKTVMVDSRELFKEQKKCGIDPSPKQLISFINQHCKIIKA